MSEHPPFQRRVRKEYRAAVAESQAILPVSVPMPMPVPVPLSAVPVSVPVPMESDGKHVLCDSHRLNVS